MSAEATSTSLLSFAPEEGSAFEARAPNTTSGSVAVAPAAAIDPDRLANPRDDPPLPVSASLPDPTLGVSGVTEVTGRGARDVRRADESVIERSIKRK